MRNIYLCGQTGVVNRGCEAIIRSTVKVLGARSGDITLATFTPNEDRRMVKELGVNMISYAKHPTQIHRLLCALVRQINKKSVAGQGIIQKPLFSRLTKEDLCLNVGGDTYCYGRPRGSFALNRNNFKKGIQTVLWCCSVEPDSIKGELKEDLKKYSLIFAREKLTYDGLIDAGINNSKVVKCCDPAFFLDMKEVSLPQGFKEKATVGVNVSGITVEAENKYAYKNVIALIKDILEKTDMSVCLIPHVYKTNPVYGDLKILKKIQEEINDKRISIVDQEYTCEELKYIISKCRFFVGARTHSTIAAYSTCVPTLVIGYSIKSKGIATDLFGTYDGYVLPYTELTEKNELSKAFFDIVEKEQEIIERLKTFLPKYRAQLTNGIKEHLDYGADAEKFTICEQEICSGCSACATVCPQKCITMQPNSEGFLTPVIDYSQCIKCKKCINTCPVANKPKDEYKKPKAYMVYNQDDDQRKNSSSGGVFVALAEKVLKEDGIVFGAVVDSDCVVRHKYCTRVEELSAFLKSKYVQSEIGDAYVQAKDFLMAGKKVLFCGTPCQIGGLYAVLGKDYQNLIAIDFICHGVPSPKVLEKYKTFREYKAKSRVAKISFRDKAKGWKEYSLKMTFENLTEYSATVKEDLYLRGFVGNLCLRKSCARCSFKQMTRQSQLTLADFWGVNQFLNESNDDKGISLVLVHRASGEQLFESIKERLFIQEVSFDKAIKRNKSYLFSIEHSLYRKVFFKKLDKKRIDKNLSKNVKVNLFTKIRKAYYKFIRCE